MTAGGVPAAEVRHRAKPGPPRLALEAASVLLLFAAKAAVGAFVLSIGFTHVSDDDYARVVIAQQFAHRPTLDPSGTSWLPFPFWVAGGAMQLLGRSLATAGAVAFALGVLSVAAPYAAMRGAGCGRATALVAVGVAGALPWSAWLGVATVPEAFTACLIAAAAIAMSAGSPRARLLAALALLAASLSRYEAWPVCALFAGHCLLSAWTARREPRGAKEAAHVTRYFGASVVAMAGPAAWMAWNAHAHASAVHFLARVAAYRQAIGAAAIPLSEKITAFPVALASASPPLLALALAGAFVLPFDAVLRARWLAPLAAAGAILAFLVYGDVRDGAPTHHPVRAVLPILWILVAFAADALRTFARRAAWGRPRREMWVVGLGLAGAVAWLALLPASLRDAPGSSDAESRSAQIARGRELASAGESGGWIITPCAYEHFALIAASGEPERFTTLPAAQAPVTAACPRIERAGREREDQGGASLH